VKKFTLDYCEQILADIGCNNCVLYIQCTLVQCIPERMSIICKLSRAPVRIKWKIVFSYDHHPYPNFHVNSSLDSIRDWLNLGKNSICNRKFFYENWLIAAKFCLCIHVGVLWMNKIKRKYMGWCSSKTITFSSAAFAQLWITGNALRQGWKFINCSLCQELCQQASWILIGYTQE